MTAIYGQTWSDTARDAIVALLEELRDDMTAYSPTFSYVYSRHHDVMSLPAVSVDVGGAARGEYVAKSTTNAIARYEIPFSVRVHLDYADGVQNGQDAMRVLNSIVNKLEANRTLADHYYIDTVDNMDAMEAFSESDTVGGELIVTVNVLINHTEE